MRQNSRRLWALTAIGTALAASPHLATAQTLPPACPAPDPAAGGPVNAHTRHVETMILPAVVDEATKPRTLAERMTAWQVPGVTVAVIKNGKLDWARGWGVRDMSSCAPVTPDTVFQAASISKPVFAVAVMKLAEAGQLDIDADIALALKSWQLPAAPAVSTAPINLRQLLSHTAGLTISGFPGYERDEKIPTLLGTLNGEPMPRAYAALAGGASHADGVVREIAPGTEWKYSGGGYVLAQQVVEDVTGEPMEFTAQRLVLGPLGMTRSSFAQPPSARTLANASSGHGTNGVIPGSFNLYPQQAAAGLWTTPTDLARLMIDLRRSARGDSGALLSRASAETMTTPGIGDWAVGFSAKGIGAAREIGHGGANAGFRNWATMLLENGDGVIVMTNSASGGDLANEIMRTVANDYGWTALASKRLESIAVPQATLETYVGHYAFGPVAAKVTRVGDRLFARTRSPVPERLLMLSPTRFRASSSGIEAEFESDANGAITGIRIVSGGPAVVLTRGPAPASDSGTEALLLRGSMNEWGTGTRLTPVSDGSLSAEVALVPGDYQFKLGSADWEAINLGTDGLVPVAVGGAPVVLTPGGTNIRIKIAANGTYRFAFKAGDDGKATLAVTKTD